MIRLFASHIGSYPRIGEEKDQQRHRRSLAHFEAKEISAHAFRDVEQSVIQELIREQILTGLDEITDGLVGWKDPITHFCRTTSGIEISGLARYFDANFYYRIPVIVSRPKKKGSVLLDEFQYAQGISSKPVRTVLTGPLTLAQHTRSRLKPYSQLASRVEFFTDLIADEITTLVSKGATIIQVDEPSIGQLPDKFPLLAKSFDQLSSASGSARLVLNAYFFPLADLYDKLATLPLHGLSLDFTHDSKKLLDKMLSKPTKLQIGFGLVNARNTRLEPIDPILKVIRQWAEKTEAPDCYVSPNCGLEFLPRDSAHSKLKLVVRIRDEFITSFEPTATHA